MAEAAVETSPAVHTSMRTLLTYALGALVVVHAVVLLVFVRNPVAASRICIATVPVLAAICFFWRAQRLPVRERIPWRWLSASLILWASGQVVETLIGQSSAASNLAVDASDFLYVTAAFPLLLAVSSTRETESVRSVFYLDSAQILLAFVLTYFRLYRMSMPAAQAATVMARIYGAECVVLAIAAVIRLATWSTLEERRRIRLLCACVWIYLPIELGMDFATRRWNLRAGTFFDLIWSVPFLFAGWQALHMPLDEKPAELPKNLSRGRLLIESLCPMLITAGIFALAASITSQHAELGLSAIFILLLTQSLYAGMMQLKYLTGRHLLLEREQELQSANLALERLSLIDPLTGVSNRRQFTAALQDCWRRALRKQESIAVLMIDLDFFKGINDLHGHTYGDQCLITVAQLLGQQAGRPGDLLARYGGEEFVLLMPQTVQAGADAVAERMHDAILKLAIVNDASPFDGLLTVSIGSAVCIPRTGMDADALVDNADQALYEAKRLGRNRICSKTL